MGDRGDGSVAWRGAAVVAVLGAALGAAGCGPSDRWSVFEDSLELERRQHRMAPEVAERLAFDEDARATPDWVEGEGPIELSVEEATLMALEHNRDLQVQRLTPVIVATFEEIERGVFDPEVFARGDFLNEETVEVSRATEEEFPSRFTDTFGEVGLAQRLPTGTDVELSVSQGRSSSNRAPDQDVARVGLTLTQALLEGAGSAVNLASVRQAELETLASLYELDGFTEALVAEAETAYWLYTVAAQRIRIIEESLAIARRQAEEVEQRIEIGVLPLTEAASSQAEISQREQELIDARARLETLRFRLLRLVNPSKSGRLDRAVIALTEASTEATPITDVSERVLLAMARRPDLNEARLRLDQARLETIVTKNGLLPRLDLFITLGKTGYADSFSDSFRELDGPTYDFAAGVAFRQPLWNRSARARDLAARTSRDQAALAIENLEQIVELDVRTAAAEAERARQQIDASAATRALREEALRAENERFRVGQSTSLLIAQAQRDLLDSQIAEVDARVAYRLALIQLYLAEGTLLERRGLVVGDGEGR